MCTDKCVYAGESQRGQRRTQGSYSIFLPCSLQTGSLAEATSRLVPSQPQGSSSPHPPRATGLQAHHTRYLCYDLHSGPQACTKTLTESSLQPFSCLSTTKTQMPLAEFLPISGFLHQHLDRRVKKEKHRGPWTGADSLGSTLASPR